ncbi:MAG: site-2 protease family protein, partial [Chloroflexi bacterium]|nr:site-2 protease family protein [Chloroflexota bacterium]
MGPGGGPGWTGGTHLIDGLINVVLLLLILVALVVLHEFGHFATARMARVRVHEFGI